MYKVARVETIQDVLMIKAPLVNALAGVSEWTFLSLHLEPAFWLKTLCKSITAKSTYAIAAFDIKQLVAFGLAVEVPLAFFPGKIMLVQGMFMRAGHRDAMKLLQYHFEQWCKEQEVSFYFLTSTRQSGSATTCFKSFGLSKKSAIYMKGVQ